MALAVDILNTCFQKTKELLFSIKKNYWFKMAFVSLFSGNNYSYNFNMPSSRSYNINKSLANITFKESISQFNAKSIEILSKYGFIVGILIFFLYLISLLFAYINSLFTFVFLDGIVKKEINIKNSIKETKTQAISLFFFRLIFGLINFFIFLAIFSPLIIAFFNNTLADFKIINLVFIIIGFIIYSILFGIFLFLINDFVVPIMYLKKYTFKEAFNHFKNIAKNKKFEVFMYWLLKIALSIASAFMILLLSLVILIFLGVFFLIGILFYFLLKSNLIIAIIIIGIYAFICILFLIYLSAILNLPFKIFFEIYKLEMISALETNTQFNISSNASDFKK